MLFITLIVTYILSVLDAVTQKRSFAMGVSGLGKQGTETVKKGWNRDNEELREIDLPVIAAYALYPISGVITV